MKVGTVKGKSGVDSTATQAGGEEGSNLQSEAKAVPVESSSNSKPSNAGIAEDNGSIASALHESERSVQPSHENGIVSQRAETAELTEELFWARAELLGKLASSEQELELNERRLTEAKARHESVTQEKLELEEKMPTLKGMVEQCRTAVIDVARDLSVIVREKKLPTPRKNELVVRDASTPNAGDKSAVNTESSTEQEDTSWRAYSTAELLKGVEGIGKTKLEAIIDLAPTVGHLQDLRVQASTELKLFKDLLPKGCKGEKTSDAVDSAVCNFVADWDKKQALGAPTAKGIAELLYKEFRQQATDEPWLPEDCEVGEGDSEYTHAGFTACTEGKPYTSLPFTDEDKARPWIIGFVCAEVVRDSKTAMSDEPVKNADASSPKEEHSAQPQSKSTGGRGRKKPSAKAKKPTGKSGASIADQF